MSTGKRFRVFMLLFAMIVGCFLLMHAQTPAPTAATAAKDPGVRAGTVNAGQPLSNLSSNQALFFQDGQTRFQE
jgi:hypothetical protein